MRAVPCWLVDRCGVYLSTYLDSYSPLVTYRYLCAPPRYLCYSSLDLAFARRALAAAPDRWSWRWAAQAAAAAERLSLSLTDEADAMVRLLQVSGNRQRGRV